MKPDRMHQTQLTPTSVDTTEQGEPPAAAIPMAADRTPSGPATAANDAITSPDPMDVERLVLSFDRPPRPPAPVPDERPSSDGGRFVAYGATGRPVQPQPGEDIRRQALGELSVLVNVTPVPPEAVQRDASTARRAPNPRRTTLALCMGAMVVAGGGILAVLAARSPSPDWHRPVSGTVAASSAVSAIAAPPAAPRRVDSTAPARDDRDREPVSPTAPRAPSRPPAPARRAVTAPATVPATAASSVPASSEKQPFTTW